MRLVKDRDLDVLCTVLSRVRDLIEQHGIFRLLESTTVDPIVCYLAMRLMMTVD